jgi:phenylalanyl-tRNA synthetase beta chain
MRASLNWLKDFVDFSLSSDELSHLLTMTGLEVEEIEVTDDDTIFEVAITPNRPDCLSIKGIAREVSSSLELPLKDTKVKIEGEGKGPVIEINDHHLCPRYVSRIIYGVKTGPTPDWISRRLESHGFRSSNNIVDITNYVMLEMGHPMHAFDLDRLAGEKINVRTAGSTKDFHTLDSKKRDLTGDTLLICDEEKPVALAGIMGGLNSEVTSSTVNILLESAYFDPVSIRRTSKRLSLSTESSYRFERGADINVLKTALDRAVQLITEIAGGKVTGITDNYPEPHIVKPISVGFNKINSLMGIDINEEHALSFLNSLGIKSRREGKGIVVEPPSYRHDIKNDADVIEEIARLYRYDRIPVSLPSIRMHPLPDNTGRRIMNKTKNSMIRSGFTEVINLSFMSPDVLDRINIPADDRRRALVFIKNPLRKEESALRTSLLPGLLENVRVNINRGERALSFFEISRVFFASGQKLPQEVVQMAAVFTRETDDSIWNKRHTGFFDIKGALENLFDDLKVAFEQETPSSEPYLHPGKSFTINVDGHMTGSLGTLHPGVAHAMDLPEHISIFEIYDLKKLLSSIPSKIIFTPLPKYPYVERDIAIVVSRDVTVKQAKEAVSKINSDLVESVRLFDIYTGKPIPDNKKSLAFSIRYRADGRTLTDEEVDALHEKILNNLELSIKAELRG